MAVATKRRVASFCRRGDHLGCARAEAICECACHMQPVKPPPDPKPRSEAAKARHAATREKQAALVRPWITKEEAPCCNARRDYLNRLPIGYCSGSCVRRPKR